MCWFPFKEPELFFHQTSSQNPVDPGISFWGQPALTCTICSLPAKDCTRCRSAAFFSPTWLVSAQNSLQKLYHTVRSRPSPTHKLGILSPPDITLPKLVWVNIVGTRIPNLEGLFDAPDVSSFLTYGPGGRFDPEQLVIEPHRIERARHINHTLAVYMSDNFGSDGSKMTQSANKIMDGKMTHEWKGPLLVISMEG